MEDGDDDVSRTADERKCKVNQESSENEMCESKDDDDDDDDDDVSSGEEDPSSPTTHHRYDDDYGDERLTVSPQPCDKVLSNEESENKMCSSGPKFDDNSEFLGSDCDEQHDVTGLSPSTITDEQPKDESEVVSHDDNSNPYDDRSEQEVSEEETRCLLLSQETEDVHSSVGEEEHQAVEEEEEEEEEKEENRKNELSVSSENFNSGEPENCEQTSIDNVKENESSDTDSENECIADITIKESKNECIAEMTNKESEGEIAEVTNKESESECITKVSNKENECIVNAEMSEESENESVKSFEHVHFESKEKITLKIEESDILDKGSVEISSAEKERSLSVEHDTNEENSSLKIEESNTEEVEANNVEKKTYVNEKHAENNDSNQNPVCSDSEDMIVEENLSDLTEKGNEISSMADESNVKDLDESINRQKGSERTEISGNLVEIVPQIVYKSDKCSVDDNITQQNQEISPIDEVESKSMLEKMDGMTESAELSGENGDLSGLEEEVNLVDLEKTEHKDEKKQCKDPDKDITLSSQDCEENEVASDLGLNPFHLSTQTENILPSEDLPLDENTTQAMEEDSKIKEISGISPYNEIKPSSPVSPEKAVCNKISEELDKNTSDNNQFTDCSLKSMQKEDMSVKVNGEVETNENYLSDAEITAVPKEKVNLKRKLSSPTEEISSETSPESIKGNIHYKGFKKRYIAQVSSKESQDAASSVQEELKVKNKRPTKKLVLETPQVLVSHQPLPDGAQATTPLTEYAQYLGLQPTVKFKCYNCGESGFPSMLKLQEHQNMCLKNIRVHTYSKPPPTPFVEPAPSTNFRITRKVYLCSACGTYYENWNLFLHMREVHKRHICLFCLLMFSQADKLAQHLSAKHGIADSSFSSPEQFLNEFKSSFFVMCCTCEQMFSERDDFFDHMCKDTSVINTDQACSLCGLKGAHFPTCRRAFTDSSSLSSPSQSNQPSTAVNSNTDAPQNSQLPEKSVFSKFSAQSDKVTSGRKTFNKFSEQSHRPEKSHISGDDDYDISDAASYCHVNIHEPDKQKTGSSEGRVSKKDYANNEKNGDEKKNIMENKTETPSKDVELEETIKDDDSSKIEGSTFNEENSDVGDESQLQAERQHPKTGEKEESIEMDVDDKEESNFNSLNVKDSKVRDVGHDTTLTDKSKSPKDGGESDSDSSASGGDSRESDGSSSSSEVSSDDNEPEKENPQSDKSEESDVEKSDSDKMSIIVDEAKSDSEREKQENVDNDNSNVEEMETSEHQKDSLVEPECKSNEKSVNNVDLGEEHQDNIQIAGDDVPLLELTLEETLDALPIQTVVKECVKISCSSCVYCNHAKKIAVNGKQLVLHLLAEHRFEPVVCSDSGELTPIVGFVDNLKAKLSELQDMYFNTDSYDSADKHFTRPYDKTYECFHCHFITTLHKELYVHNRKMHQKTILLCIMCKSNFYSYSELLCHLCPGIYVPDSNILFRCCLCVVDGLPSAFRLMVHLRKRHHACDVCLETTGDQQKLSNHVWKHKLHHLCYRCGIAYRNKPDITKHLFWKHGTESVLCKKCLQKKWPHVYHFCIPPTAFLCEECNASFSRAVALKVHKRLHTGDISYQCEECDEKFISKKLVRRHKEKHNAVVDKDYTDENDADHEMQESEQDEVKSHTPVVEKNDGHEEVKEECSESRVEKSSELTKNCGGTDAAEVPTENEESELNKQTDEVKGDKKSKVVDVYDLPPLNLSSESDDSDNELPSKELPKEEMEVEEPPKVDEVEKSPETEEAVKNAVADPPSEPSNEEEHQPVHVVDGVWDNFKTYKANLEKREILQAQANGSIQAGSSTSMDDPENHTIVDIVMADHDYCVQPEKPPQESLSHVNEATNTEATNEDRKETDNPDDKGGYGADHNYCFNTSPQPEDKKEITPPLPPVASNTTSQTESSPLPTLSVAPTPQSPPPPPPTPPSHLGSSPKKKQKSPKKKQKQSGSSSSSDSSSNSDSSSCTCGTNCSCSSSSSSSSGSSSSSSDSDSSSSEGRRRQAARRERRRERAKKKLETGSKGGTPPPGSVSAETGANGGGTSETTPTPFHIDSSGAGSLLVDDTPMTAAPDPEENELLIRESDLDTTETETDEDFYDKYPQKQANKLLAEKRNQLLLLAAVAPVNNGTIAQPSPPPPPATQEPVQKKKVKTKRHKKSQHNISEKKESKLKLNIPAAYYSSPSYAVSNTGHPASPLANSQTPISSHMSRLPYDSHSPAIPEAPPTPTAYHSTGSGSETESKRLSKRKRIPKKFYGDSSDEEAEQTPQQPYKWRKVTSVNTSTPHAQPTVPSGFGYRASINVVPPEPIRIHSLPPPEKSDDEDGDESDNGQDVKRSSSDSSNSDSDNEQSDVDSDVDTAPTVPNVVSSVSGNVTQQKNENLYCYCQCPYDEVSEMIACDGKDCSIEWFHFECVGIMVPPKGKWFCPDCRKKTAARSEYLLHA